MKCVEVVEQVSFYTYGEVSPEMEERIESHLASCADCTKEFARHRAMFEMLDRREAPVRVHESALLAECRMDLRRQLATEASARPAASWLERLRGLTQFHIPMRVPVGAMALFALGWFGARYTPAKFGGIQAGLGQPMFSNVQSVQYGGSGKVQIAVDDVQRRVVTGGLEDPLIQQLLLDAVREESNPGVRVESIGILRNSADSEQIRGALVDALSHDPNAGVRLKALEGLKPYAGDAAVRKTLANVLLRDDNPGVRVQAIDLLTAHHDDSIVGVLQDVMQKEDDGYIRTRTRDLLETMKASVGTY
jgi:hypothetical protein